MRPDCSVEGCERPRKGDEWCSLHWKRWKRTGRPEGVRTYSPRLPPGASQLERWWAKVDRRGDDECWYWTAQLEKAGYGRFRFNGKPLKAHRVGYELLVGPIPEGMVTDHRCHTNDLSCPGGVACLHRRCVNPAHLDIVTVVENMRRKCVRITHCPQGHEYTAENTYRAPGAPESRVCRRCARERDQERRAS